MNSLPPELPKVISVKLDDVIENYQKKDEKDITACVCKVRNIENGMVKRSNGTMRRAVSKHGEQLVKPKKLNPNCPKHNDHKCLCMKEKAKYCSYHNHETNFNRELWICHNCSPKETLKWTVEKHDCLGIDDDCPTAGGQQRDHKHSHYLCKRHNKKYGKYQDDKVVKCDSCALDEEQNFTKIVEWFTIHKIRKRTMSKEQWEWLNEYIRKRGNNNEEYLLTIKDPKERKSFIKRFFNFKEVTKFEEYEIDHTKIEKFMTDNELMEFYKPENINDQVNEEFSVWKDWAEETEELLYAVEKKDKKDKKDWIKKTELYTIEEEEEIEELYEEDKKDWVKETKETVAIEKECIKSTTYAKVISTYNNKLTTCTNKQQSKVEEKKIQNQLVKPTTILKPSEKPTAMMKPSEKLTTILKPSEKQKTMLNSSEKPTIMMKLSEKPTQQSKIVKNDKIETYQLKSQTTMPKPLEKPTQQSKIVKSNKIEAYQLESYAKVVGKHFMKEEQQPTMPKPSEKQTTMKPSEKPTTIILKPSKKLTQQLKIVKNDEIEAFQLKTYAKVVGEHCMKEKPSKIKEKQVQGQLKVSKYSKEKPTHKSWDEKRNGQNHIKHNHPIRNRNGEGLEQSDHIKGRNNERVNVYPVKSGVNKYGNTWIRYSNGKIKYINKTGEIRYTHDKYSNKTRQY